MPSLLFVMLVMLVPTSLMVYVWRRQRELDARMGDDARLPVDPAKLAAVLESIRDRNARRAAGDAAATRESLEIDLRALGLMRDAMPQREYRRRLDAVLEEYGVTGRRG